MSLNVYKDNRNGFFFRFFWFENRLDLSYLIYFLVFDKNNYFLVKLTWPEVEVKHIRILLYFLKFSLVVFFFNKIISLFFSLTQSLYARSFLLLKKMMGFDQIICKQVFNKGCKVFVHSKYRS